MKKKKPQLLLKRLFLLTSQIERDYVSHFKHTTIMVYSHEVENMCVVKKGPNHGPAPIPEEGKWIKAKAENFLENNKPIIEPKITAPQFTKTANINTPESK